MVWAYTLVSVAVVSLLSLVGVVTLAWRRESIQRIVFFLVSFAVGGLFGDAFIHLLPQSFEMFGIGLTAPAYTLAGIFTFFILEKFLRWRHCHAEPCEFHTQPLVVTNLVGDAAHNLIDGMLIGASYCIDVKIGIATTLAIILHEIPHELGNFGVLVHGGLSIKKALLFNFLSALFAIVGAVAILIAGEHLKGYSEILIPITAGGFIYIAGSDLIPELQHDVKIKDSVVQFVCILFGVGLMALLAVVG